jgi:predicted amidohydrolase
MVRKQFRDQIISAIEQGAEVVMLPELSVYAAAQISGMQDPIKLGRFFWDEIVPEIADLSRATRTLILPGSAPFPTNRRPENSAAMVVEGQVFRQPKLTLTHWEYEYQKGEAIHAVTWKGLVWVTLICFDIEQPELAVFLKSKIKPNVILIPSATGDNFASERVHRTACSRAVELGAACLVTPLVGTNLNNPVVDQNEGQAGVYLPVQSALESTPSKQVSPYWTEGTHQFWIDLPLNTLQSLKRPEPSDTRPYLYPVPTDDLRITRSGDLL